MEHILMLSLGMLSTLLLLGVGYAVVGVSRVSRKTNDTEENIQGIYQHVEKLEGEVYRSLGDEISEVNRGADSRQEDVWRRFEDLERTIDSRFDKFENKLRSDLSSTNI
jgi:peptidoglycan hydrolase CwlO-like protein